MALSAIGWLIVKLLILAALYFGIVWLVDWLGISVPPMLMKIFAAILVIIGIIYVLAFLGL